MPEKHCSERVSARLALPAVGAGQRLQQLQAPCLSNGHWGRGEKQMSLLISSLEF